MTKKDFDKIPLNKRVYAKVITGMLITLLWMGLPTGVEARVLAIKSTSTSVTLQWDAPGDNGADGTASQYDFRYSTSIITEANWNLATQITNEPTPLSAGTSQTVVISGLNPNTQYYFAAKSADEVPNWSQLSSVVIRSTVFVSGDETPPAAVADLR